MKISNSKKELARIISENGGWCDGAEWAIQHGTGRIAFTKSTKKPLWEKDNAGWGGSFFFGGFSFRKLQQHHQNALSRAEYFHLYPAPDADGWIEWEAPWFGSLPCDEDAVVDVIVDDVVHEGYTAKNWRNWGSVTHYRLHKPKQAKTFGADAIGVAESTPEAKPTIEQLAADYHNAKDCAERKQQEADVAKADADAKLKAIELACEDIGFLVSPIIAKQEPELVITNRSQLELGDVIWIGETGCKTDDDRMPSGEYVVVKVGMIGVLNGDETYYPDFSVRGWRFIRRP